MQSPLRFKLPLLAALIVVSGVLNVAAQGRGQQRALSHSDKIKAGQTARERRDTAARKERERQEAITTLVEAATDARSINNPSQRAIAQANAADALWPFDAPSARAIFRRAWEAATEVDAAASKSNTGFLSGMAEIANDKEPPSSMSVAFTRGDILPVAAKHDARFAETFLRELDENTARQKSARSPDDDADERHQLDFMEFGVLGQRLGLADMLMSEGEYKRASEIAAPVVEAGVSGNLIVFILQLRTRAPTEADALYLRLIERTKADPSADANDVLLLSAPVVSPKLLTVMDERGSVRFHPVFYGAEDAPIIATPAIPQLVRKAFFDAASNVLLRTLAPRAGEETGAGRSLATFYAVGRLLPFFAAEAPQYVAALQARQAALVADVGAGRSVSLASQMQTRSLSPENPPDPLQLETERLKIARDEATRDDARLAAIKKAARLKLWERARGLVTGIEDTELRRDAQTLVVSAQVLNVAEADADDEDAKDFERAALFVHSADVPAFVRAAGLAQAAELAARKDKRVRAGELLDEATSFAERSAQGTPERLAVFGVLTMSAARMNAPRMYELLTTFARAADAMKSYPGDGLSLELNIGSTDRNITAQPTGEVFEFEEVFAATARRSFPRTLAEARSLNDAASRAMALIAASRVVLEADGERRDKPTAAH